MENVFRVCIAWYKHERGWENSRQLRKTSTSSRVCITVSNSSSPSSLYIRLCKRSKKVFFWFYKITFSKNYNAGKDLRKFILLIKTYLATTLTDNGISQLTHQNLHFKIWWWRVYNSCILTSHDQVYIFSCNHASRPIRPCVLSLLFYNKIISLSLFFSPESLSTNLKLLHTLWFTLFPADIDSKENSMGLQENVKNVFQPSNVALEVVLVCWTLLGQLRWGLKTLYTIFTGDRLKIRLRLSLPRGCPLTSEAVWRS